MSTKDKFEALSKLGAGDFEHLDGTLIEHLNGTKQLLKEWGARTELQDAGLYHAAYGTAGFDESLVSANQRNSIVEVIGETSEEIVYQYCACDRGVFFAQFKSKDRPKFKNRFTGESYYLTENMLNEFCALTAANEIEIATDNPDFVVKHGVALNALFINMRPYLSMKAIQETTLIFGAG